MQPELTNTSKRGMEISGFMSKERKNINLIRHVYETSVSDIIPRIPNVTDGNNVIEFTYRSPFNDVYKCRITIAPGPYNIPMLNDAIAKALSEFDEKQSVKNGWCVSGRRKPWGLSAIELRERKQCAS